MSTNCPFGCHSYTMREADGTTTFTFASPDCFKHGVIGFTANVLIFSQEEVDTLKRNLFARDERSRLLRSKLEPGIRVSLDKLDLAILLRASTMRSLTDRLTDLAERMETSRTGTPAEMRGPRDRYNKRRK